MIPSAKKFLASGLSAALVWTSFPTAVLAGGGDKKKAPEQGLAQEAVSTEAALEFLRSQKVFNGDSDEIRSYLVNGGQLSPMGEVLYKQLKLSANPGEEVQALEQTLENIRKSGRVTDKKRQSIQKAVDLYESKFRMLDEAMKGDGAGENTFRVGTLREAMMSGAAVIDSEKQKFNQVQTENGWEFWDKDGLAFRLNKQQAQVYNRDLQKNQRLMNQARPPAADPIPETGRYNYQMLGYSYWRLHDQLAELDKNYHIDRMVNMAELLGRQFKNDKWFLDRTLEEDLVAHAKKKFFKHGGKPYSVFDIVEKKMKARLAYMEGLRNEDGSIKEKGARQGLEDFKREMERLKGSGDSITEANIKTMQLHEFFTMRFLSLVYLESQRFHVKNQLERLDPESPDSDMITKAIEDSEMSKEDREKYKASGQKLRKKVERLLKIFKQVQDTLLASDYAGSLDIVQAALNQSGKEVGEMGLDYTLYAELPSASFLAKTQLSGTTLHNLGGWAKGAYRSAGKLWGSEHSQRMDKVEAMLPQYKAAEKLVGSGRFAEARQLIIAMHPDAVERERELSPKQSSARITDAMRVSASLQESRRVLAKVAETNQWVDTVGNYATWTVGLALGAGVLSRTFGVIGKVASMGPTEPILGIIPSPFKIIEEVAFHARERLNSLAPAAENIRSTNMVLRYLEISACRFVSASARQGGFTLLSGGISGTFTVLAHVKDEYLPQADLKLIKVGQHSNFERSGWGALEAFGTGAKGGIVWANESFMPGLGYIGLPSTSFEGTRLAKITQSLGERGVFGNLGAAARGLGIPISEKIGLNTLAKGGAAGKFGAFALGMTDNVGKYVVFNEVIGTVGEKVSWYSNYDEVDIERRIKRAQHTGMHLMELPLWLMIPVFPAKYEAAASEHQNSLQGVQQYKAEKLEYKLANAGPEERLPMGKPKVPFSQLFFNLRFRGEPKETTFVVPKEARREAISNTLVEVLSGGKPNATAKDINPLEFLKVSQLENGKTVGDKLHMSDEVAVEARNKFSEALQKNPTLTEKILNIELGTNIPDFGVVTQKVRNEVALSMHMHKAEGGKVSKPVAEKAAAILKDYLKSNEVTKPFAERFLEAERKLSKAKDSHPVVDQTANELVRDVQAWVLGNENPESVYYKQSYQEFIVNARKQADKKLKAGSMTADEHAVFKTMYDYVESLEVRFNSFNKVEVVSKLSKEILGSLAVQFKGNKAVSKILEVFAEKINKWDAAQTDRDGPVQGSRSDNSFNDTLALLDQCLAGGHGCGKVSIKELNTLKEAVKDLRDAAWVLHDAKGGALPGWRPVQFEGLMTSLALIASQGKGGLPIRQFIMLTTGGGKTMLTFEGLLPLAEADAFHHGKMDVMFLTVQANLEAQARLEFIAYKKIGSKLQFETYEGLKSKIAEGKLYLKDVAKRTWILGDEMDGAALQPMLTIGEVTARVVRAGSVYHLMERINDHIELTVGKGAKELAETVRTEARRAQTAIDHLDALSPEGLAARKTTTELLKAAEELSRVTTPEGLAAVKERIVELVGRQNALVQSQPLSLQVKSMEGAGSTVAELTAVNESMAKELEALRTNPGNEQSQIQARERIAKLQAQKQVILDAAPMVFKTSVEALEKLNIQLEAAEAKAGSKAISDKIEAVAGEQKTLMSLSGEGGTLKAPEKYLGEGGMKAAIEEIGRINSFMIEAQHNMVHGKTRESRAVAEAGLKKLARMKAEITQAAPAIVKGSAKQLETLRASLETAQAPVEKIKTEMKAVLKGQQSLLDASGLAETAAGKSAKSASHSLSAKLASGEYGESAAAAKQALKAQRASLGNDVIIERDQAKAVAESGQKILDKLNASAEIGKAEASQIIREVNKGYRQQENLLNLISDSPEVRVQALREKARDLRVSAERKYGAALRESARDLRVEAEKGYRALKRTEPNSPKLAEMQADIAAAKELEARASKLAGGKMDAAEAGRLRAELEKRYEATSKTDPNSRLLNSLQEDIRIAKQFEASTPSLAKGREEALAARESASAELKTLDAAWEALSAEIRAAKENKTPTGGLEAKLEELMGQKKAVSAQYWDAVEALRPGKKDIEYARELFAENAKEIQKTVEGGQPGWEGRARELMSARRQLLESFAYSENPIYSIYRQLKEDMYSTAHSVARQQDDAQVLRQVVRETRKVAGEQIAAIEPTLKILKEVEASNPAAKELLAKAEAFKKGYKEADLMATSFENGQTMIRGVRDNMAGWVKGLRAVKNGGGLSAEATAGLEAAIAKAREGGEALARGDKILDMTADKAAELWNRRIDGASLTSLIVKGDIPALGLRWAKNKVISLFGGETKPIEVDISRFGLSRVRGMQLLKAVASDPLMGPTQQQNLFMDIFSSILWPRGPRGKGNSYVRTEMINMARGYFENPATIRMDNLTGLVNVVHNGQWFESMDNPGRRWWELEYGTDLTLPYKHRTVSTIKDITTNKKSRFISLSGTAEKEFQDHLHENDVRVGGTGSAKPKDVRLDMRAGPSESFGSIKEALTIAAGQAEGMVVVAPKEAGVPTAVKTYMEKLGLAKKDAAVVKISDAPPGEVRDYFQSLKKIQPTNTSLVVLSLSDTKVLKAVRRYLIRSGQAKPDEIASVFAGTEELRLRRHEAKVHEQMNLKGLDTGKIKILMLDTRVGGRGLDLNFKGDRGNSAPDAFKGYTNFKMLIVSPNEMSSVHLLQSEGRIDLGRVFPGAAREFSLVLDVRAAQEEVIFKKMINQDDFFIALRADPAFQRHMEKTGRAEPDWAAVHDYFTKLEREVSEGAAKGQDVAAKAEHLMDYREVVMTYLEAKQLEVAKDQLRQASVKDDSPSFDPKLRGLELAR